MPPATTQDGLSGRRLLAKSALLALIWLVLADGDLRSPLIAALALMAALAAALAVRPPPRRRLRLRGMLGFAPFFLRNSVLGGFDVAVRAFRPSRPLDPELVGFRLRLEPGTQAAIFFVDLVNLLPGTLCAEVEGRDLTLHFVDRRQENAARLRRLEGKIAAVFSEPLAAAEGEA